MQPEELKSLIEMVSATKACGQQLEINSAHMGCPDIEIVLKPYRKVKA